MIGSREIVKIDSFLQIASIGRESCIRILGQKLKAISNDTCSFDDSSDRSLVDTAGYRGRAELFDSWQTKNEGITVPYEKKFVVQIYGERFVTAAKMIFF